GTVLERPTVAINPSEGLERGEYPLRALVQGVAWPEDVDPTKREEYLSAAEFEEVFGMTKEEFRALPRYVRIRTKKEKLLF
ncbi:Avil, partial [Symbiodinium microadriaticum]